MFRSVCLTLKFCLCHCLD
uniref:Uncharacterized protein n=1 Tax=Anguilla anguilla TaxID=7936 RepID=A0A0E9U9E8_ANGAN